MAEGSWCALRCALSTPDADVVEPVCLYGDRGLKNYVVNEIVTFISCEQ